MLTAIKFQANPRAEQRPTLSQWMGCVRVIYNSKCEEDRYTSLYNLSKRNGVEVSFEERKPDQQVSQFDDRELTPWLLRCPSQIKRNVAVFWYKAKQDQILKGSGKPKKRRKTMLVAFI